MRTLVVLTVVLLVSGSLGFAVDYTWTGGAADTSWASNANWSVGGSYPDGDDDKAIIPAAIADSITTAGALTIGELDMQSGCTADITLGGTFTVSTNGGEIGNMTISDGTFYCNGHDLDVAERVYIGGSGTLDAHTGGDPSVSIGSASVSSAWNLDINGSGTYNATSNTTTLIGSLDFNAPNTSWIHNQGTLRFAPGTGGAIIHDSMTGADALYNLDCDEDLNAYYDHDIQGDLTGANYYRVRISGTLRLGTASRASQVSVTGLYGFPDPVQRICGVHPDYKARITSTQMTIMNGNDPGYTPDILYLDNVHFDRTVYGSDASTRVRVLEGDCEFEKLTLNANQTYLKFVSV